jgi:phasin family protein
MPAEPTNLPISAADVMLDRLGEATLAATDAGTALTVFEHNVAAMAAANRAVLDGAQTVANRHVELVRAALAEATTRLQALGATATPEAKAAQQAALLKAAYQQGLAQIQELERLIRAVNTDALALLQRRLDAVLREAGTLLDRAGTA